MRAVDFVALSILITVFTLQPARAACPVPPPNDLITAGTLTFGTTNVPAAPGVKLPNQTGFELDLMNAIAGAMCLKADTVQLAFAGLFPALDAHKFDAAIAGIGISAQREQSYDFVPYFLGGMRLLVRKDSGLSFKDESGVCGHSVAALSGSVEVHDLEKYKDRCPSGKPMTLTVFPTNQEVLEQLRKGTVQIVFFDWAPVADIVDRNPGDFAIASPVLSGEPPGEPRHRVGFMLRKGDTSMKDAIAAAIKQLQSDGTYDALLNKWGLKDGDIRLAG
jgi:polar amino acid transport system substrate-binding protein